jgi:Flp pilus assembly CpaF family ATPase
MPKSIILSEQQNNVLEKFKEGLNIFLSGEAGTRKTVTINEIIKYCKALKKALKNKELLVKKEELEKNYFKIIDKYKLINDEIRCVLALKL